MKLTRGRRIALFAGILVFLVGSTTSASWALWSTSDTVSGSATAATVSIVANGAAGVNLTGLTTAADGPGVQLTTSVAVQNNGNLAITYNGTIVSTETPTGAVIGDNVTYTAWIVSSASSCTNTARVTGTSFTGNLNTGTKTLGTGRTLAAGATETYCVRTKMGTSAPATIEGQSLAAVMNFVGSASGWSDTATASFTQSSAKTIEGATYSTCITDLPNTQARLTWPTAPATMNGNAFTGYYIEWIYTSGANNGTTILTAIRTDPYAQPATTGLTGNSMIRVTYQYANNWTYSPLPTYAFVTSTNGNKSPVCSPEMP